MISKRKMRRKKLMPLLYVLVFIAVLCGSLFIYFYFKAPTAVSAPPVASPTVTAAMQAPIKSPLDDDLANAQAMPAIKASNPVASIFASFDKLYQSASSGYQQISKMPENEILLSTTNLALEIFMADMLKLAPIISEFQQLENGFSGNGGEIVLQDNGVYSFTVTLSDESAVAQGTMDIVNNILNYEVRTIAQDEEQGSLIRYCELVQKDSSMYAQLYNQAFPYKGSTYMMVENQILCFAYDKSIEYSALSKLSEASELDWEKFASKAERKLECRNGFVAFEGKQLN